MFDFITRLFKPQTKFYDETLQHATDVVGVGPAYTTPLADDVALELYVGDSGGGKNTWATAVIAVQVGKKEWRTKYDGGRINNDIEKMAEECLTNIRVGWDLDLWRKMARKEIK